MAEFSFVSVVPEETKGKRTTVIGSDGNTYTLEGSAAWRNNNPGALKYGPRAKSFGAIGETPPPPGSPDGIGYAIFPTRDAGLQAYTDLMFSAHKNKTIAQAISTYAVDEAIAAYPNYAEDLAKAAGVSKNTKIGDLSPEQREAVMAAQFGIEASGHGKGKISRNDGQPVDFQVARAVEGIRLPPGNIPSVASQMDTTAPGGSYTVQRGDTLGKIAKQAGTTVDAIAKANGIRDVNKIQAGAKLSIPGQASSRPTTQPQTIDEPRVAAARSLGTLLPPPIASLGNTPRASQWQEAGGPVMRGDIPLPRARPEPPARSLGASYQPLPAPAPLRPQAGPQQPVKRTASAPVPMALPADRRPVLEPTSKVLGDGKVQLPRPRPQFASLTPKTVTGEEPTTGGFGGFLGGIGSNLQALGGNVMEGARTLGKNVNDAKDAVGEKVVEGAMAIVPEMLRTVSGRTALLDPMISNLGTDEPLKYANIKRKRAEVQANRAAQAQKSGVASQVSTSPGNSQTFKGSSGRTYTVGKTYSNSKGSFIAQPGGKFVPAPAKAAPVQTNQLAINPNISGRTDRFANTVDQFGMVI
jgi:hypothetical protein